MKALKVTLAAVIGAALLTSCSGGGDSLSQEEFENLAQEAVNTNRGPGSTVSCSSGIEKISGLDEEGQISRTTDCSVTNPEGVTEEIGFYFLWEDEEADTYRIDYFG